MRNKLTKITLSATLGLALALTFSCSSDDNEGNASSASITGGSNLSSSSVGVGGSSSSVTGGGVSCPTGINGTFVDLRDNKSYKWVKICEQTWMAENLNYEGFVNGVNGNYWCYDEKPANCDKYGILYDWATAMGIDTIYNYKEWGESDVNHRGICPSGWHLPNIADWRVLMKSVNPSCERYQNFSSCNDVVGGALKATSGWADYRGQSGNGTDVYGFAALPGGRYILERSVDYPGLDKTFEDVNRLGQWWLSGEQLPYSSKYIPHLAPNWAMTYRGDVSSIGPGENKYSFFSVRCLKDD